MVAPSLGGHCIITLYNHLPSSILHLYHTTSSTMTTAKKTNTGDSQRKSSNNQSRANVAKANTSNNTSKKTNKQNQSQAQSQQTSKQPKQQTVQQTLSAAPTKTRSPSPQPTAYVPLPGFNGEEIDALLASGDDGTALAYESEKQFKQKSSEKGMFGHQENNNLLTISAGTMATGKDFWAELRKQAAMLQRGESTNKGG